MMLVTLEQAREHLEVIGSSQDSKITLFVEAASAAVLDYIGDADFLDFLDSAGDPILDSNDEPIGIPSTVKIATLLLVGMFYRDREGTEVDKWAHGYLPTPVTRLLYPYRRLVAR